MYFAANGFSIFTSFLIVTVLMLLFLDKDAMEMSFPFPIDDI